MIRSLLCLAFILASVLVSAHSAFSEDVEPQNSNPNEVESPSENPDILFTQPNSSQLEQDSPSSLVSIDQPPRKTREYLSPDDPRVKSLSREYIAQKALEGMKLDPNSKEGKILRQMVLQANPDGSAKNGSTGIIDGVRPYTNEDEELRPMLAHIKLDGGSLFPTADELMRMRDEIAKPYLEKVLQMSAQFSEKDEQRLINAQLDEISTPPKLNRCQKSGTQKAKIDGAPGPLPTTDMLFIFEPVPENSGELFGVGTMVQQYKSEKGEWLTAGYARMGFPCLPYRTRTVGDTIFQHMGRDALRNFDANPMGKGKLHPEVKTRFLGDIE